MKKIAIILIGLLSAVTSSLFAQISYGGVPLPYDRNSLRSVSLSGDFFIDMPDFDVESMLIEDSINKANHLRAIRFAKKFEVNMTPENSGTHFKTETGMNVWRVGIRSEGAYSLNVLFSEFHIPEGAQLFLYNSNQTKILGAFTHKNNTEHRIFPVSPVAGDELIIEYQEPENVSFQGKLTISEVNHDYTGILKARPAPPSPASCLEEPICRDDLDIETQAVCLIVINGNLYCSASMINNVEEDAIPYLLTSCHCLNDNGRIPEEAAKTVVVFFNYQSPTCDSNIRGSEEMSMVSPIHRASDKNLDFALLELSEMPPPDFLPYYLGWNISKSPDLNFTCIHQSGGGIKKFAESAEPLEVRTNYSIDLRRFDELWRVTRWKTGVTEGGSSGSPLLDKNRRIIGALTGGSSTCSSPLNDFFWTMKKAWDMYTEPEKQLKAWLDPNNTGITTIGGMNPYDEKESCERISNFSRNEAFDVYLLNQPETGHLFGYNSLNTNEYAESFNTAYPGYLYGVSFVTPIIQENSNQKANVSVCVYSGEETPDELLAGPFLFNPTYTNYRNSNFSEENKSYNNAAEGYLRFVEPIEVGKRFFISYKLDYTERKTPFTVYGAANRSNVNTAFFKMNDEWLPASAHPNNPKKTSLWINPVIKFNRDGVELIDTLANEIARIDYKGNGMYAITISESLKNAKLEAYTVSGQRISQTHFSTNPMIVDLSQHPRGVYIFKIEDEAGVVFRSKLVR